MSYISLGGIQEITSYKNSDSFEIENLGFLEDLIPGYITISSNRGLVNNKLKFIETYSNRSIFQQTGLENREIEVKFAILDNSGDLNDTYLKLNKLNEYLYRLKNTKIYFNNEQGYFYKVYKSETKIDSIDSTGNAVGTYKLVCLDPFKYASNYYTPTQTNDLNIQIQPSPPLINIYNNELSNAKITIKTSSDSFKFYKDDYFVELNTPVNVGDIVYIDFDEDKVFINGSNAISKMNWKSTLENFYINQNDIIYVNTASTIEINLRHKLL